MQSSLKSLLTLTGVLAFFLAVFAFIGFQHKMLAWVYLFAVLLLCGQSILIWAWRERKRRQ